MNEKLKRIYVPMTETAFYILFCLREGMHGYNIIQEVQNMTNNQLIIAPGTMYGTLSKMEKDGLINFMKREDNRKIYKISQLGQKILDIELKRIERIYLNSKGVRYEG